MIDVGRQIELFTPALKHKEKALEALRRFAIAEGKGQLESARQIDPYLAELGTLTQAADFLLSLGIHAKTKPGGLARAWARVQQAGTYLPRTVCSVVESLLCGRIVQLLPEDDCGFVDPKQERLHVGACYLVLNCPGDAHRRLLDYLTRHREEPQARLWGYFGDASFLLKRHEECNSGYLRGLVMDPQAVDLERLQHPDLRRILESLRRQHDEETARALLPIHAWLEGVLRVPTGNTWLARFIRKRRFDHSAELLLYPAQRYHQFALCLYIDQCGLHGEIDFDARVEMQRLDGELFARYLEVLARVQTDGNAGPRG